MRMKWDSCGARDWLAVAKCNFLCVFAVLLFAVAPARSAESQSTLPRLYTNQQFVEDVTKQSSLEIDDIPAVLEYVLNALPDRVRVYPTENYYYFYFYHGGVKYAGNIRFDVTDRDLGLVEFIYFKATTNVSHDDIDNHATLGAKDGVAVEKVDDLVYRVTFRGRSVTFELNDLSQVRAPASVLGENEMFLGPVADESGVRFFLIFDEDLKIFHYVLDETVPVADELLSLPGWSRILVARRTDFAFLSDPFLDRKLLVGVFKPNGAVNNYYDGPFDQLPDNFLEGDVLRRVLLAARPDLETTTIDRLGIYPDGQFREEIAPYLPFKSVTELAPLEACAVRGDREAVYLCIDDYVLGGQDN